MKNSTNKDAYYERLRNLSDINKTSIKETKNRTLGTLIDYKRAADGVAYGIVQENHNYYLKKGGTKVDPNASDFAYIGGLANITNYQYKSFGDADKNRNMILHTINEAITTKVNVNGSKKMLNEDRAGQEIDNAQNMLGDLDAASAAKQNGGGEGEAEMAAGLNAEPAGPEEMPAPEGEAPAPAPETGDETGGEAPAPAPETGDETGDETPAPEMGDEVPELGDETGGEAPAPEMGDEVPELGDETGGDETGGQSEPIRELEKSIGKLTNTIRKTELEPSEAKSFLKSLIQSFKDKLPELEIEDRKEIANMILKIVPPEDVAGLSDSMPPEEKEVEESQQGCSECGTFAQYAESMGYKTADELMECGEEGVANLVSNYANHAADGQNDGDPEGVALVIKVVNPKMLDTLKNDYGHEEYANQLEPMVNSMQENTEEECYSKLQEMFGGQTDTSNVQTQPIMEEDDEPEAETMTDEPDAIEEPTSEPEEIKFGGAQTLGAGVAKPDGAPTTISVSSANGTSVEVSLNEVMKKLKEVIAESKKVKVGENKASAGLSKEKKNEVVKKAKGGEDIGEKGKGFEKVAQKAAKEYGSKEKGEKVAAAAMWKGIKKEGKEDKEAMTESEKKIRAYIRKRLEEQAGIRKPSLNEGKKSEALKKLDSLIKTQFDLYENMIKKKSNINELFGFGGNNNNEQKNAIINQIKELTQKMSEADPSTVVFAGGSPEKQIEMITKIASDNKFRGEVRLMKSYKDDRIYLRYLPKLSNFQQAASGAAAGIRGT